MSGYENKVVFAIGYEDDKTPVIILGISEKAWDYMKDGKTHSFDLTRVGIGAKLILFGGKTLEECMKSLPIGPGTIDISKKDMGIK